MLAGLVHGARVSLLIGVVATRAAVCIGLVGAVAGYLRRHRRRPLMRSTEFFQTIPPFSSRSCWSPSSALVAVISRRSRIVSWPPVARLVRAEFLTLRGRDFVRLRAIGMSDAAHHLPQILPNASAAHRRRLAHGRPAILIEAGLSFLGLGDPN